MDLNDFDLRARMYVRRQYVKQVFIACAYGLSGGAILWLLCECAARCCAGFTMF